MTSNTSDSEIEALRLGHQIELDAQRSAKERNELGQFATPPALADDIIRYALSLHRSRDIRFLEPSCGSGSFYSSLRRAIDDSHTVSSALGVELDPRFAAAAQMLWGDGGLEVVEGDFTDPANTPSGEFSLLVANPPYVRHHHLSGEQKKKLVSRAKSEVGITVSGLSGLYVHFVLLAHRTLASGAMSAWLIPSEFMDVNYGKALKQYLTKNVTLVRVHRFAAHDMQFDDALVTSAVVVFRNDLPQPGHIADFTFGGSVSEPREHFAVPVKELDPATKWSGRFSKVKAGNDDYPLFADYFKIRRGIATGSNAFFVMPRAEAQMKGFKPEHLRPILPSPRYLKVERVESDSDGYPLIDTPLALIDTRKPIEQLRIDDPALAEYLESAPEALRSAYLVSKRNPWYAQEERPAAPFLLTYMGRGVDLERPFKFILNRSQAVVANSYLMLYPRPVMQKFLDSDPDGLDRVHKALLSLSGKDLRDGGRVYGGGLHKMEPKELAALNATAIRSLEPDLFEIPTQQTLL